MVYAQNEVLFEGNFPSHLQAKIEEKENSLLQRNLDRLSSPRLPSIQPCQMEALSRRSTKVFAHRTWHIQITWNKQAAFYDGVWLVI